LCEKAEAMLRLAPSLMDLDWVIGQLALPEAARRRVAEAWADFFVAWGVLPMTQVLSGDRLGILLGIERGPTGEREILWSGEGAYRDRFTGATPAGFFEALRDALLRLGLAVEPELGTMRLGQLELERTVQRPLREALQRGELVASPDGFRRAAPDLFSIEHEAVIFADIVDRGGEELHAAARVAALVAPLERALRFRTTGAVQGCAVQRARLPLPGDSIGLYALRGSDGMIQLAFYGHGDALWRQSSPGSSVLPAT
jgi:hypothetical protein